MRRQPDTAGPRWAILLASAAVLLAPACADRDRASNGAPTSMATAARQPSSSTPVAGSLWTALSRDQAMSAGSRSAPWFRTAREAMPTTVFRVNGVMENRYVSDLFVVARVTAVEGGRSYSWPNGPDIAGQPSGKKVLEFNADDAMVSSIYITATVERAVSRDTGLAAGAVVRIGVTLLGKADLSNFQADLPGTRIAALLTANERSMYAEDPGVFGSLENGRLLGLIDDQDVVSFPAWELGPRDTAGAPVAVPLAELLTPVTPIAVKSP